LSQENMNDKVSLSWILYLAGELLENFVVESRLACEDVVLDMSGIWGNKSYVG